MRTLCSPLGWTMLAIFAFSAGCLDAEKHGPAAGANPGAGTLGDTINIAEATEIDLVETLARHRANYANYLVALRNYYIQKGYSQKAKWAERELADLRLVKTYAYVVPAEIRRADEARPIESIPEADALYADAMNYAKQGGYQGIPLVFDQRMLKKALEKFNQIIRDYPTSDKVDDAAFRCAEIYKEYFNDNERAVVYYQRAWEWDPQTPHPARFQAAVVYDYRLHDRDRALELYNEVVQKETRIRSNVRWSVERIKQLTGERSVPAAAEATPPEPAAAPPEGMPEETEPEPGQSPP